MTNSNEETGAPTVVTLDIEVRYAETDQMGVVHHSNYLVWFELARTRLCATTEIPYDQIEKLGYFLMVTGAHLSYRGSATYGDVVQARCWMERLASRVVHFGYEISKDNQLLVRGTTEHVWVDRETMKTVRIPPAVKPLFEALARNAVVTAPRTASRLEGPGSVDRNFRSNGVLPRPSL